MIALERAGIKVNKYFASEIKEIAIKVSQYNYPDIIQVGDVNNIYYKDGVLHTENGNYNIEFDLVIFGSPCQTFSIALAHLPEKRIGLKDAKKSGLFYECNRILKEVNPKYFFMENVASMKNSDRDTISEYLGVKPIMIDSQLVSAALRKRYYWTNIPNIKQPEDKKILFQNILTDGYTNRKKARCLVVSDSRPNTTPIKMYHRYVSTGFTTLIFKSEQHYIDCKNEYKRLKGNKEKLRAVDLDDYNGNIFDGVRYMNQDEAEQCQTVPKGYTKCLSLLDAKNVLGDCWTVDVIVNIFKNLQITT